MTSINEQLVDACISGNLDSVKSLYSMGADLTFQNCLEKAINYKQTKVVEFLKKELETVYVEKLIVLCKEPNVDFEKFKRFYSLAKFKKEETVNLVQIAIKNKHYNIVRYIKEKDNIVETLTKCMISCCKKANEDFIEFKELESMGADITNKDIIRYASVNGHYNIVNYLNKKGIDNSSWYNEELLKCIDTFKELSKNTKETFTEYNTSNFNKSSLTFHKTLNEYRFYYKLPFYQPSEYTPLDEDGNFDESVGSSSKIIPKPIFDINYLELYFKKGLMKNFENIHISSILLSHTATFIVVYFTKM